MKLSLALLLTLAVSHSFSQTRFSYISPSQTGCDQKENQLLYPDFCKKTN